MTKKKSKKPNGGGWLQPQWWIAKTVKNGQQMSFWLAFFFAHRIGVMGAPCMETSIDDEKHLGAPVGSFWTQQAASKPQKSGFQVGGGGGLGGGPDQKLMGVRSLNNDFTRG